MAPYLLYFIKIILNHHRLYIVNYIPYFLFKDKIYMYLRSTGSASTLKFKISVPENIHCSYLRTHPEQPFCSQYFIQNMNLELV